MRKIRKRDRLPPFVPMTWVLLNSLAYKKLTPSAGKALPYFLGKVKLTFGDPARYSTPLKFSYPEGKRLGFSTATFSRITKELARVGFTEYYERGGLRGQGQGYNKYILSRKWESFKQEQPITKPQISPYAISKEAVNIFNQLRLRRRNIPNCS